MGADRRRVRSLLLAVFVPVVIVVGVLASAVLGDPGADRPTPVPRPALTPVPLLGNAPAGTPPPVQAPGAVSPSAPLTPQSPPPEAAAPEPDEPGPDPQFSTEFVPDGAVRTDVGSGAQSAAIFEPTRTAGAPGPVVIFLHGWVALDPRRYGPWIAHLVRRGVSVIYPTYQTKPAYNTITPLTDALAGIRLALPHVGLAPGRLVVAGHSAGAALAADYAAAAPSAGLPAPAAVFSVYPGRKLRHLAVPIPSANLAQIARGTRVLVFAGERDTAVGNGTARRIVALAKHADATLRTITDDAVDEHSAPRTSSGAAQRTFWAPLDGLIAATPPASSSAGAP